MSNQSIQRGARILSIFSLSTPKLRLTQIAKELGVPLSTANGLVKTLVEAGFLNRAGEHKEYQLGLWLIELGAQKMATSEINQSGVLPANYLGRDLGLTVRLGVLERDAIVVTYCSLYPNSATHLRQDLGAPFPTYCTSMGRAILAFSPADEVTAHLRRIKLVSYTPFTKVDPEELLAAIDETRTKGYSIVTNEMTLNLQAVGAPIFRAGGSVAGGISLSGNPAQLAEIGVDEIARRVMETANHISQQMGYFSFEPIFHSRR